MPDWDSDYVDAFRSDGAGGVNRLLRSRFQGDDLVRALERLAETGDWSIDWHSTKRFGAQKIDSGKVREYLRE